MSRNVFLFNTFLKKNVIEQEEQVDEVMEEVIVPSISVPEQAGGANVFIGSATLPDGGYVVIHKDLEGKPGAIIGISEFLSEGTTSNFLIDLDEEAVDGDSLFAMLHIDDGDRSFAFPGADIPVANIEGNIVLTKFGIVDEGELEEEVKL